MRGTVEKLPSGAYRLSVFLGKDPLTGKMHRARKTVIARTEKEAETELAKLVSELNGNAYVPTAKETLGEFLARWLRDYVALMPKTSTRESYDRRVKKHLIPAIGHIKLAKLAVAHLQKFYRSKLESGLSSTSVNDLHRTLHRALATAVREGLLARNICDAAEPPKKRRAEVDTWTPEQCAKFLAAARENRHYPLFAAAIYTGMRQGELLGLRWQDVNLDRGTLTVQQTLEAPGPTPRFGTPKSAKSRRTVPLGSDLVAILRTWKAKQNEERLLLGTEYRDYGLVFTIPGGGAINRQNLARRDFARLIAVADVPPIRFHDLRHSFASLLLGANYDLKLVSEMMGHSGIAITADTYGHLRLGPKREAADVIGHLLSPNAS